VSADISDCIRHLTFRSEAVRDEAVAAVAVVHRGGRLGYDVLIGHKDNGEVRYCPAMAIARWRDPDVGELAVGVVLDEVFFNGARKSYTTDYLFGCAFDAVLEHVRPFSDGPRGQDALYDAALYLISKIPVAKITTNKQEGLS